MGEKAFHAQQIYKDNKKRWQSLTKTIAPRRINGNHWLRFSLHINELKKVAERYGDAFEDTIRIMENTGISIVTDDGKVTLS